MRVLPLDEGEVLIPSVVAWDQERVVVGRHAARILKERPQDGVASIKRLMGRSRSQVTRTPSPYTLDDQTPDLRVRLGPLSWTPEELSAQILAFVKQSAAQMLGHPITHAVITVPAYFDDAARHATRQAAQRAGFNVLRLLNEPTAAALAYGLDRDLEGPYAVYDWGGGTFDLSILNLTQGVFQVLATGGDTTLGGDDFDHALLNVWHAQTGAPPLDEAEMRRCLPWVRQARHVLSSHETVTTLIPWPSGTQEHTCDRSTLEILITPYVERTLQVCRRVLQDSGIPASDLKGVVLVGGATRTPLIRTAIARFFPCAIHQDLNPDEIVAMGAALQASSLTQGGSTLLLDVTPLSLGVETMGKLVDVLIPRNTPIPMRQTQWYTTYKDNQEALAIHVVQGESEYVEQCRSLGRFELHGLPPLPAGQARIQVIFEVDANGLLTVTAQEQSTGHAHTLRVQPCEGLSFDSVVDLLQKGSES